MHDKQKWPTRLFLLLSGFIFLLTACSESQPAITEQEQQVGQSQSSNKVEQQSGAQFETTTSADVSKPELEPETIRSDPYRDLPIGSQQLAAELIEAEQAIADQETKQAEIQAYWGPRQQVLYRQLWANIDWEDTVTAEVKAKGDNHLLTAFTNNWGARKESSALVNSVTASKNLPAWKIQSPEKPEILLSYYKEAEEATGIEWEYLAAVNLIETVVGRIEGVSTAGAVGPMQFLPSTWEDCCEGDPTNTKDAIMGAATYLVDRGGATSMDKALFGYNNSQYYVNSVTGYAEVMKSNEQTFYGYHGWQVFFQTNNGLLHLDEGYSQDSEVLAETWIKENPESIVKEIQTK